MEPAHSNEEFLLSAAVKNWKDECERLCLEKRAIALKDLGGADDFAFIRSIVAKHGLEIDFKQRHIVLKPAARV